LIGVNALAASLFPNCLPHVLVLHRGVSGATVLIGQAYGARDEERLKTVAGTALPAALVSGAELVLPDRCCT